MRGAWCLVLGAVRAIPGLKYTLQWTDSLRRSEGVSPDPEWGEVKSAIVTGTLVTLTDEEPPEGQAFYRVGVSVP